MHCWITSRCIACGLCVCTCPELFAMNNNTGQAVVKQIQIPPEQAGMVEEVVASCPAGAIVTAP